MNEASSALMKPRPDGWAAVGGFSGVGSATSSHGPNRDRQPAAGDARRTGAQGGYSLAEMLVVIAIVGIISVILVPNFMSMYRSSKAKTAVRNFTTKLRNAQQLAITSHNPAMVEFTLNGNSYSLWSSTIDQVTGAITWTKLQGISYKLEERGTGSNAPEVLFNTTGFQTSYTTITLPADTTNKVVFNQNGTIILPDAPNQPEIVIHSSDRIPKPTYTISIGLTGSITVS